MTEAPSRGEKDAPLSSLINPFIDSNSESHTETEKYSRYRASLYYGTVIILMKISGRLTRSSVLLGVLEFI